MPYNVIDMDYHPKPKSANYVFDTNILLPVLGFPLNPNDPQKEQQYLAYFNAVYTHLKQHTEFKIYIPSVQLSELFNRILQAEAKKYYKGQQAQGAFPSFYKKIFRAMTACKSAFELYKADLLVYANVLTFREYDEPLPLGDLLDFDVLKLDINDMVILRLAQQTGAILVSDDGDYEGQEITQATLNKTLIRNAKSRIGRR